MKKGEMLLGLVVFVVALLGAIDTIKNHDPVHHQYVVPRVEAPPLRAALDRGDLLPEEFLVP